MERPPAKINPRRAVYVRLAALGVFAVVVAIFYFSGAADYLSWDTLKERRDDWHAVVAENRLPAAFLFLLLSVALMSASLPVGSILSIAAGALFDLWYGVGLIAIASAIGSTIAFLASRYLMRDFVRHWFGRWLAKVDRGIEEDGAHYLLVLRLSPVVPFFALNATMGLTKIRLQTFILVSLIGMLPSCFLYVMVGTQIMRINSPRDIVSPQLIVLFSVLAFSPLLFRWLMRRRARPESEPAPDSPIVEQPS